MQKQLPKVSISMITFHAQDFIAEAIESILKQKVDFPIELVIGDDCSRDRTREICKQYAEKYPNIIRVLPEEKNMGISANTARTMGQCTGKYIAVCDGDDVWTDPYKLKKQVDFLEKNPDYGIVYSDVETISETGAPAKDPDQDAIRTMYKQGDVFLNLLASNFINNSTALFRRDLLNGHVVLLDRSYQIPDYFRWLYISAQSKVHFINEKTTAYRRHSSSLSKDVPDHLLNGNWQAFQISLFNILPVFDKSNKRNLSTKENMLVFRKMMSLVFRRPGSFGQKFRILRLMPKYFPGITDLLKISATKVLSVFPATFRKKLAHKVFWS